MTTDMQIAEIAILVTRHSGLSFLSYVQKQNHSFANPPILAIDSDCSFGGVHGCRCSLADRFVKGQSLQRFRRKENES